eukprot:TRINITY_DN36665_c0_g1_i1.p1 TRINITY_DN36665_c0_g1~~TRINITY_DN36665_c0_g1_i1.p1  ORF type:complete len:313 (+),score=62.21 TRINITY_DN36665_c0_g1_i1:62-940(+)
MADLPEAETADPDDLLEYTCAICLELLVEPLSLPCSHVFCRQCLASTLKETSEQRRCPLCRAAISDWFNAFQAPADKELERTIMRACTVEYTQRLEDIALQAASLIQLRISNTFEYVGFAAQLPYNWTLSVDLERSEAAAELPADAALPDIVDKVRFGLKPACKLLRRGHETVAQRDRTPRLVDVVKGPYQISGSSRLAFTIPIIVFFKEELQTAPLRLEHGLDFHREGGSWSYGVELGTAMAARDESQSQLHPSGQSHRQGVPVASRMSCGSFPSMGRLMSSVRRIFIRQA